MMAMGGFSVQIYCDFSAYSDMAIALACMFGIKFPENFHSPLTKKSITASWSAWHMTLTNWLRDYVMIPIYARTRHASKHVALILTMLISGLWHGADWTFIVWGLCHGVVMAIELATGYTRFTAAATGLTGVVLVALNFSLWSLLNVLFRAQDLATAVAMWRALFTWPVEWTLPESPVLYLCVVLLCVHKFDRASWILEKAKSVDKRILLPICMLLIIGGITVAQGRPSTFYYFDF
jgi:alginate O-acetyltransferase complex protein AlgI